MNVSPELADRVFDPMARAQLLRTIQEALTNARKHERAHRVDVRIAVRDGRAEATVQDDSGGFDPALLQAAGDQKFGLHVMQERAEEVGGSVQVHSAPGECARVVISLPPPLGGGAVAEPCMDAENPALQATPFDSPESPLKRYSPHSPVRIVTFARVCRTPSRLIVPEERC